MGTRAVGRIRPAGRAMGTEGHSFLLGNKPEKALKQLKQQICICMNGPGKIGAGCPVLPAQCTECSKSWFKYLMISACYVWHCGFGACGSPAWDLVTCLSAEALLSFFFGQRFGTNCKYIAIIAVIVCTCHILMRNYPSLAHNLKRQSQGELTMALVWHTRTGDPADSIRPDGGTGRPLEMPGQGGSPTYQVWLRLSHCNLTHVWRMGTWMFTANRQWPEVYDLCHTFCTLHKR